MPGAFSITYLEALDQNAQQKVREGSRDSLIDMLKMDGFVGATTATIGTRVVTISARDRTGLASAAQNCRTRTVLVRISGRA